MKKRKMGLFKKTFLYMTALFGLIILVAHLSMYLLLPSFYIRNMEGELDVKMVSLKEAVSGLSYQKLDDFFSNWAKANRISILTEIRGKKQAYMGGEIEMDDFLEGKKLEIRGAEGVDTVLARQMELLTLDGENIRIQGAISTRPVHEAGAAALSLLPVTISLSLVISFLFSWFYSRKITEPILEMAKITGQMQQLEKGAAFPVTTTDEIGSLGAHINHLYETLWKTIQALEEENRQTAKLEKEKLDFLRAASHELKTPLASLRILLENMQYNIGKYKDHETYLAEGIGQVDMLTAMVQEILDVSRMQGVNRGNADIFQVKEELQEIGERFATLAQAKRLRLLIKEIPEDFEIEMDRGQFGKVWRNLLGNAVSYSCSGGEIRVSSEGDSLKIFNTCVPMKEEELAHIFEAFYRPDFGRSRQDGGNGLGLYLVKEILSTWQVDCCFCPVENGMEFVMDLGKIRKK